MSLTAVQVAERTTGLGGSDAAAACGVSRWKTPLQVYLEKRGEVPAFEGNDFTRWGERLEPVIRQQYSDETGRIVRLPVETIRHPEIPFLLCHPDGVAEGGAGEVGRLFEAKNTRSAEGWGPAGSDEIPQEYLVQVQHNMLVTGLPVADVAVLIQGSDFRIYEIPADREIHDLLIRAESALWARIEKGEPPPATTAEDVRLLYGRSSVPREVEATQEIAAAVENLAGLKAHAAVIDELIEEAETAIKAFLGEADTLVVGGKPVATWKASKPVARFDAAAMKAAHPDIHAQFVRTGDPYRRFLLK